ncbi:DNA polymerase III subunit chi [Chitinibacteraceae bacterium HSL-7]
MRVRFFYNVSHRERALCQIVGKALARGQTLNVLCADDAARQHVDRLLWEMPHTGFMPHCAADAPHASNTPAIIDHRVDLMTARDLLINWSNDVPPEVLRERTLVETVEIVDRDETLRAQLRDRVRSYRSLGITPEIIDMDQLAAAAGSS